MKLPNIKYTPSELFSLKNSSRSEKAKKNIIILFILQVFNFFCLMAIAAVLNISLSIGLAKYAGFGITGIMIAINICLIFASFIFPVQYRRLITMQKGYGINDLKVCQQTIK